MPTTADTPVPPRVRFAPIVLLSSLALALGGLSLSGGPTATGQTSASALARDLREGPTPAVVALAPSPVRATSVSKAQPTRRAPRATRKRVAVDRWVRPVAAGVVSTYGPRWGRMHEGLDFDGYQGAPIRAVGDGIVIGAGYLASESGYGKIVLIRHRSGAVTAYAHMSRVLTHAGERVRAGDLIGRVGSTGHSTGPHLHFEVRVGGTPIDPRRWLRRHGVYV